MKKAEEGIDCGECPNEDWFRGGIKCSIFIDVLHRFLQVLDNLFLLPIALLLNLSLC